MKNLDAKMLFGFCLLGIYLILAIAIAFGRIEESTSFGLQFILTGLTGVGGAWSVWAFSHKKDDEK